MQTGIRQDQLISIDPERNNSVDAQIMSTNHQKYAESMYRRLWVRLTNDRRYENFEN